MLLPLFVDVIMTRTEEREYRKIKEKNERKSRKKNQK
jgi:hypothetical protein